MVRFIYWVRGECMLTFADLRPERDVLGGGALDLLLGRHGCGIESDFCESSNSVLELKFEVEKVYLK